MKHQNISVTGSLNLNGVGVATTANLNAFTASSNSKVDTLIAQTGSYATTGSNTFTGAQVVQGTLTAQTLVVQTVTSSVLFSTGSNKLGSSLSNVQELTGSVGITGSLAINGTTAVVGSGTANYVPKFTAGSTIGNSLIQDNATDVGINGSPTSIGGYTSLTINNTSNGSFIDLNNSGVNNLRFLCLSSVDQRIQAAGALTFYTAGVVRLTLASTGAATFSSSVTVGGGTSGGSTFAINNGGAEAKQTFAGFSSNLNLTQCYNNSGAVYVTDEYRAASYIYKIGTTEAMRITSTGNVGIGTTTPGLNLSVQGLYGLPSTSGVQGTGIFRVQDSASNIALDMGVIQNAGNWIQSGNKANSAVLPLVLNPSGGNVLIGSTTSGLTNGTAITLGGGSIQLEGTSYVFYGNRTTSDGLFMGIRRNNVDVGSITVTTSATAFNTSSDYRLKTDFKDYNGLSLINSIKTYDYAWAIDNTRAYGVKAHELQELLPYMVFGEKDATNDDDSIKPQAVDYSKIVPVLVKAIQEQQVQIEELKTLLKA